MTTSPTRCLHNLAFGLAALGLTALAGCTQGPAEPAGQKDLRALAGLYARYTSQHKGQPPANDQQFKEFIKKEQPTANVDELFTSPRDKQPYKVLYSQKSSAQNTAQGGPAVAYEQAGVDGKRLVAFGLGQVRELDEAEFKAAVKAP